MFGLLLVAAFAGTVFPLTVFPETDLHLGGIAILLALRLLGFRQGLCAALLAGLFFLLHGLHLHEIPLILAETTTVGWLLRKGVPGGLVGGDAVFWILIGVPFLFGWQALLGPAPAVHFPEILARTVFGLANALAAAGLFYLIQRYRHGRSLWEAQINLLCLCFLFPPLLYLGWNFLALRDALTPGLEAALATDCTTLQSRFAERQKKLRQALEDLARLAVQPDSSSSDRLYRRIEVLREELPELLEIVVTGPRGRIVAAAPFDASLPDRLPKPMAVGRPVLRKANSDGRHLFWEVPFPSRGPSSSRVWGLVATNPVRDLLAQLSGQPFSLLLLDSLGKTIAQTEANPRSGEFHRPATGEKFALSAATFLWSPESGTLRRLPFWLTHPPLTLSATGQGPWLLAVQVPRGLLRAHLQNVFAQTLAIMLVPALTALFFLRLWHQRLVTPLRRLTEKTRSASEPISDDDLADWPVGTGVEIDALVANYQALAAALEKSRSEQKAMQKRSEATLENLLVQRNWEVSRAGRALKNEAEQRQQIEQLMGQLKATEARYRFLVEKSLVGVFISAGENLIYANPRFAEIFGFAEDEIMAGRRITDLVHGPDRSLVAGTLRTHMLGQKDVATYQFRGQGKNRQVIHIEALTGKGSYKGQTTVFGTFLDVTERKRPRKPSNTWPFTTL